ncbi:hypothetical protein SLS56_011292 [Neofusicoccum ribis]|uniref:Major facilitator superfamily (MFS) profile domain-containing protein n=1 Tax=Neofusicoccum ribis TaxID=45134 RepID=A0ABR3SCM8_9PEZI
MESNASRDLSNNSSNVVDIELAESKVGKEILESPGSPRSSTDESSPPPRDVHGVKWALVVISLISVTFLWGLDGTIVADIQATGQVYGQFNAKYVFITCIVIFEAGSALCGGAPNIDALIAGRAICGVGGSGMYAGVLTILSLTTTEKERAFYVAVPGLTWGAGTVLGPVIGGAFAISDVGWRFGFYINLFIGALFAPVYLFLVPSKDPRPGDAFLHRVKDIDFLGLTLLAGSTTAFIMALCFGGLTYAWDSGRIIALFVVTGVTFALFIGQQLSGFGIRQKVFPFALMKNINVVIIFLSETCSAMACFLPCYFIPLYFQYVLDESPLMAGVHLLPFICFMIGTVIFSGSLVSSNGKWLPWFFYGGAMVLIGGATMFTVDENTSSAKIYGYSIILGTGTGAYIQMPFNAAQEFVDPSMIPAAVGLITWAQLAAPAVTLSIANTVFLNRAKVSLGKILPPDAPTLNIVSGVGRDYLNTLDRDVRNDVIHAIVHSLAKSYILIITSGALTLLLSGLLLVTGRRHFGRKAQSKA